VGRQGDQGYILKQMSLVEINEHWPAESAIPALGIGLCDRRKDGSRYNDLRTALTTLQQARAQHLSPRLLLGS
jgi:hypothetical protein